MTTNKALRIATEAQGYRGTHAKLSLRERFFNYIEENASFFAMAAASPDEALKLYGDAVRDAVNG